MVNEKTENLKKNGMENERASLAILILNAFLFCLKITGALLFGSVALLSDAINSLTDIFSSVISLVSVKVSQKAADESHPFGHDRAQPLAAFVTAVLMGVFGFEIIKIAAEKIVNGSAQLNSAPVIAVLTATIIVKTLMWIFAGNAVKKTGSPVLEAAATDARNDVIVDIIAITGVYLAGIGFPLFDPIAALIIGLYVIKSAADIALKNTHYLMGKSPSDHVIEEIKKEALATKGVIKINSAKAQYMGDCLQVEIHVGLDKKTNLEKAHEIGEEIEKKIEEMDKISDCIVHIDPV